MTNKGPEWQAVFGPISTAELIKGTYYILPGIYSIFGILPDV